MTFSSVSFAPLRAAARRLPALVMALFWAAALPAQGYECEELLFPRQGANRLYGYVNLLGEWRVDPVFLQAEPFQGTYAVVLQGKRYGVLNCDGILVVPAEFDQIKDFSNGTGWVRKEGAWGLVNDRGRMLLTPAFSEVRTIAPGLALHWLLRDRGNGRPQWGLFNKETGRFVVQPRYEAIQVLSDEATLVRSENDFGVMYHDGSFIVPLGMRQVTRVAPNVFTYRREDRAGAFGVLGDVLLEPAYDSIATRGSLLLFRQHGLWGLADYRGRTLLPPTYQTVGAFHQGVAAVRTNNKWGLMRADGQTVVPPTYEDAHDVHDGNWVVKQQGHWGVVNARLATVVPFAYDTILRNYDRHDFYALRSRNAHTLADLRGRPLTEERFDTVVLADPAHFMRVRTREGWSYYDATVRRHLTRDRLTAARAPHLGFAVARQVSGWGVLDSTGTWRVPPRYDSLAVLTYQPRLLLRVGSKGAFGVVDDAHHERLSPAFERVELDAGTRVLKVRRQGQWGLYDGQGAPLVPPRYDTMSYGAGQPPFPAMVARKGKWGLLDEQGHELTKLRYGPMRSLGEGWYTWEEKGRLGLLSSGGTEALPPTYLEVRPFAEGWAAARRPEGWGFVNARANPATDFIYEEVTDFNGTSAYVRLNGRWGAINRRGAFLLPAEYAGYRTLPDGTRRLYK